MIASVVAFTNRRAAKRLLLQRRPSSSSNTRSAMTARGVVLTTSRDSSQQRQQRSKLSTAISSTANKKYSPYSSSSNQRHRVRLLSSWQGHGTDLLSDSLSHADVTGDPLPKIVLKAYGTTGFDVVNSVKNMDPNDDDLTKSGGVVHYTQRSLIAFPTCCFLWNIKSVQELTIESLAPIVLYKPSLEYLFIGSNEMIPPFQLQNIKNELIQRIGKSGSNKNLVVEQMDVVSPIYG